MNRLTLLFWVLAAFFVSSCVTESNDDLGPNPFLDQDDGLGDGKADTGYVNLRGVEVEVTIEADIEAPTWQLFDGPAELAQFAVTNLRVFDDTYIEILAEDADVPDRVLWLVDGEWVSREEAVAAGVENLRRFRIPDVNVVLLYGAAEGVEEGDVIKAVVPIRPYAVMEEGGSACATYNSHLALSQSIYWYLWNPARTNCEIETQEMTLTVEEVMPRNPESYPEYDQLLEDGNLDVVVLWGKVGSGSVEDDSNWRRFNGLVEFLIEASFEEVDDAPLGRRFRRVRGDLTETIDVYGPDVFHSVADYTRFQNWQTAVSTHEVVMYNGHSVLGSGMAFERAEYPDRYQIFSVASCLSYEYYVRPVLAGHGSWDTVDVISNVKPTMPDEAFRLVTTLLARLLMGIENGGQSSWQDIMEAVSNEVGHAQFGVSGARGNCFSPEGDRCEEPPPPPPDEVRFESSTVVDIPDNDPQGASSTIEAEGGPAIGSLAIELDVTHSYVGDLTITLEHGGVTQTLREHEGGSADNILGTFEIEGFEGADSNGPWSLHISDSAQVDTGSLNSWVLVITPAE